MLQPFVILAIEGEIVYSMHKEGSDIMFDRVTYKENAKVVLKRNYWSCFIVTLLVALISGIGSTFLNIEYRVEQLELSVEQFNRFMSVAGPWITLAGIIGAIISLFVVDMLKIGQARFFIDARHGEYRPESLFMVYKSGYFWNCVFVTFMKNLYVFLWSLLFVIPGIIAGYRYYFVEYILADQPDLGKDEALALSAEMTDGIKMDLFIMELSFFGWSLLDLITFNLAHYFIAPYKQATYAEAYAAYSRGKQYYNTDYTGYYGPEDRF